MGNDHRYIETKEAAADIRKVLKKAFPGVKFSVRSELYSGGSSISVSWLNGPDDKAVDAITRPYAAATFNGLDGSTQYRPVTLSTGEVVRGARLRPHLPSAVSMTSELLPPALDRGPSHPFVVDQHRTIRRASGVTVAVCACGKGQDEHQSDIGKELGEKP